MKASFEEQRQKTSPPQAGSSNLIISFFNLPYKAIGSMKKVSKSMTDIRPAKVIPLKPRRRFKEDLFRIKLN